MLVVFFLIFKYMFIYVCVYVKIYVYVYMELYMYVNAKKTYPCAVKSYTISRTTCNHVLLWETLLNFEGKKAEGDLFSFLSPASVSLYLAQLLVLNSCCT